jgi:transposase, IS30 family
MPALTSYSRFLGEVRHLLASGIIADPYSAWQRGSNENANGLLRQYIPKGSDMTKLTQAKLAQALQNLNHRPRKCLGYRTPCEVFSAKLTGAIGT